VTHDGHVTESLEVESGRRRPSVTIQPIANMSQIVDTPSSKSVTDNIPDGWMETGRRRQIGRSVSPLRLDASRLANRATASGLGMSHFGPSGRACDALQEAISAAR